MHGEYFAKLCGNLAGAKLGCLRHVKIAFVDFDKLLVLFLFPFLLVFHTQLATLVCVCACVCVCCVLCVGRASARNLQGKCKCCFWSTKHWSCQPGIPARRTRPVRKAIFFFFFCNGRGGEQRSCGFGGNCLSQRPNFLFSVQVWPQTKRFSLT